MMSTRERSYAIWVTLILLAAGGWAVTLLYAGRMGDMDSGMSDMPSDPTPLVLFLPTWVAMMVAMMFPSAAPVASLFRAAERRRREAGGTSAPTWIFLSGYLVVWTLFGLAAYVLSLLVPALGMAAPGLAAEDRLVGGAVFILAGLYQWSPLKHVCLHHCRSPLGVFMDHWRPGRSGAFRMGFSHGAYCLGCCWGLMVVLFAVGMMNVAGMVALAAVIFSEKVLPRGALIGKVAGLGLVALGVLTSLGVTTF